MRNYKKGLSLIASIGLLGLAIPFSVSAAEASMDVVTEVAAEASLDAVAEAVAEADETPTVVMEEELEVYYESATEDLFTYSVDTNGHVTITGYSGTLAELEIPETLGGYSVVSIGYNAFGGKAELTKVTIPDTVTNIEKYAFWNCANLVEVDLPSGLQTIGYGAFHDCDALPAITIPKSLSSLKQYLTNVDNNQYDGAFIGCDSLKVVTFEEGTTQICNNLFQNCPGIEKIEIPATVTSIGNCAFSNCSNLKEVTFAGNDLDISIARYAFYNCANLEKVTLSEGVTSIGKYAFANCIKLAEINLSKSLKTIEYGAFLDCDALTSVEIPKSLNTVTPYMKYDYNNQYEGVFNGCNNLKEVTFEKGTTKICNNFFQNCPGLEKIEIPATVMSIGECAFSNCANLKEISFEEGDRDITIGDYAFYNCANLEKAKLSDGITSIGKYAFSNCTKLAEVNLPKGLTTLWYGAFYNCDAITALEIPKSLTSVVNYTYINQNHSYEGPFNGCNGLKEITFEEGITEICNSLLRNCPGVEKLEIPSSVTNINYGAFMNCTNLSEVIIPEKASNVYIADYVFYNCDRLETIEIPDNVTSLGIYAFYGCDRLSEVKLGSGISAIRNYAFNSCTSLEKIVLPFRMQSVGDYAFSGCSMLLEATLPRTVTSMGKSVFHYTTNMTIYGVSGTYAEQYANELGAKFIPISDNISSLAFINSKVFLKKNNYLSLLTEVTPVAFAEEVIWSSSNPDVVSVTNEGVIHAKKVGTVTIRMEAGTLSAECEVNVLGELGDVASDSWQYVPATFVYERGIMTGKGVLENGKVIFAPNDYLTRAEFAQILYSAENKPAVNSASSFTDVVAGQWYEKAVIWATENGIVSGYGTTYGVSDKITREQLAAILYKYAGFKGYDVSASASFDSFADADEVSGWAKTQLSWAVGAGIMNGKGENLDPQGPATRAECATMLRAFMTKYGE